MKKVKIIYNPNSGRQIVQKNVPKLSQILRENGYFVDIFKTEKRLDATNAASKACKDNYDIIVSIGGDGTVNEIINGIMINDYKPKLAIYPAGTVNDFATYLKVPRSIEAFSKLIIKENTIKTDVGVAGERYFLNVAAAGLLSDVAYKVSAESKTVLGKFAYYLKGISELPKQIFKPVKMNIKIGKYEIRKEVLFFILANSASVGGFSYIAPKAKINDGKFDLLVVEKSQFIEVARIFFKTLIGSHTKDSNLQYIQVDELKIECDENIYVDLDGEQFEKLPMEFKIKEKVVELIIPETFKY